jgi:hypothetical protein
MAMSVAHLFRRRQSTPNESRHKWDSPKPVANILVHLRGHSAAEPTRRRKKLKGSPIGQHMNDVNWPLSLSNS